MAFRPNAVTFDQGLQRIQAAISKLKTPPQRGKIVTSKDPDTVQLLRELEVKNVPDGFTKYQLPVYLNKPSQLFMSFGAPNIDVPEHSHDEGDGIRFIMWGSVEYNGQTLSGGDWMFIPAGAKYRMRVGPHGAGMCYCYCCSCA